MEGKPHCVEELFRSGGERFRFVADHFERARPARV
jgi:hypothetical protein